MRRFVTIVECGNLHAAAHRLQVTQPALTRSIKLLETQLGGKLLIRHPKGVSLTPFGEHVLDHASRILRECRIAEVELGALAEGEMGTLRIAAAPVWVAYLLPPAIAAAQERCPAMRVHVVSMDYVDAAPRLKNGDLDVFCGGFFRDETLPSFLQRRCFFQARMHVVARPGHPLLHAVPASPEELLDYPWLSYQNDWGYLDLIMDRLEARTGRRRSASVLCDVLVAALTLIQEGDYLSYLPENFTRLLPGFDLRTVTTDVPTDSFDSGMVFRRSLQSNQAFRTMTTTVEHLVAQKLDPETRTLSL